MTAIASHEPGTTGAPWVRVWPDGDGWTETPPDTGPIQWAVGLSVVADQTVVSWSGRLWRAKVTHITHAKKTVGLLKDKNSI